MALSPAQAPRRSLLSSASTGMASLLAHGCLMVPFLLLDPAPISQLRPGEIPVELVTEPPLPQKGPALPIETPVKESPPKGISEAQIEPLARGGARQKRGAQQRLAPQIGLALPFNAGPESFRAVAVPLPTASGGEAMNYSFIVGGMLERVKRYPEAAVKRGAKGVAWILKRSATG